MIFYFYSSWSRWKLRWINTGNGDVGFKRKHKYTILFLADPEAAVGCWRKSDSPMAKLQLPSPEHDFLGCAWGEPIVPVPDRTYRDRSKLWGQSAGVASESMFRVTGKKKQQQQQEQQNDVFGVNIRRAVFSFLSASLLLLPYFSLHLVLFMFFIHV